MHLSISHHAVNQTLTTTHALQQMHVAFRLSHEDTLDELNSIQMK